MGEIVIESWLRMKFFGIWINIGGLGENITLWCGLLYYKIVSTFKMLIRPNKPKHRPPDAFNCPSTLSDV